MAWYLDTSAFLKLVVVEEDSSAMRRWFARHHPTWSSQLLRTEALGASDRLGIDRNEVEDVLDSVYLVLPAASTFWMASRLALGSLRCLDALHLATALELGDDLEGVVTYDARMTQGAQSLSIAAIGPV